MPYYKCNLEVFIIVEADSRQDAIQEAKRILIDDLNNPDTGDNFIVWPVEDEKETKKEERKEVDG